MQEAKQYPDWPEKILARDIIGGARTMGISAASIEDMPDGYRGDLTASVDASEGGAALVEFAPPGVLMRLFSKTTFGVYGIKDGFSIDVNGVLVCRVNKRAPKDNFGIVTQGAAIWAAPSLYCALPEKKGDRIISVRHGEVQMSVAMGDKKEREFTVRAGQVLRIVGGTRENYKAATRTAHVEAEPAYLQEIWRILERGEHWLSSTGPSRLNRAMDKHLVAFLAPHIFFPGGGTYD